MLLRMLEIIQANYFGSAVVFLFLGGTVEQYLKNNGDISLIYLFSAALNAVFVWQSYARGG